MPLFSAWTWGLQDYDNDHTYVCRGREAASHTKTRRRQGPQRHRLAFVEGKYHHVRANLGSSADPKEREVDKSQTPLKCLLWTKKTGFRDFKLVPQMPTNYTACPMKSTNDQNPIKLAITNPEGSGPHKSPMRGENCVHSGKSVSEEPPEHLPPSHPLLPGHIHAHMHQEEFPDFCFLQVWSAFKS